MNTNPARSLGRRARLGTLLILGAVLAGLVASPAPAAATVAPAAAPATAPPAVIAPSGYSTEMPFALWEVPVAQIGTAPTLGTSYLFKSFSPGMDPVSFLNAAGARGWKVVFHFNDTINYTTGTVYPWKVAAWVNQVKDNPALGGYLIAKEPSWSGISAAELRSLRNAFRAADPNPAHQIFVDYGDSPHFGTTANPWGPGIADVLVMNWYPVRISKGYISDALLWFPKVRAYVNRTTPGTPIWIMAQTFGASRYDQRMPTAAELERQLGEALRYAKADGIAFHTWTNTWYQQVLGTSGALQAKVASLIASVKAGTFVVKASYDTTRPVMTSLSVAWSRTLRKWVVRYHATDIAGIKNYLLRWRVGTSAWHSVGLSGGSSSVALAFPRGRITIQVRSVDRAGNWGNWRTTYRY